MKTKKHVRFLALFLSLLLLILAVPLSGFAKSVPAAGTAAAPQETDGVESVEMLPDEPGSEAKIDPYGIGEVVSLREETVKHFDMGDGTYQAIAYGVAVHRKDADGEWADIDNTLTLTERGDAERFVSSDERIAFAPSLADGTIWTLSENGYSVSLSLTGEGVRGTAAAAVENHATREEQIAAAKTSEDPAALYRIDNRTTVLYENVFPGVDIEYILSGNDVKENIVIRQAGDTPTYSFVFAVEGLTADYDESGAVLLSDAKTGEAIYRIPAPYMTDAAGAYSDAVAYSFRNLGDGRFELTVSASEEWINDPERVFPVKIDPTIKNCTSYTIDTYVDATNSTTKATSYGSATELWISYYETVFIRTASLPTIPSNGVFSSAILYFPYRYNTGVTGGMDVTTHQCYQDWEDSFSWNTMSSNGSNPSLGLGSAISTVYFGADSTSNTKTATIVITALASEWYAGTNNNYGLALKRSSGNNSVILYSNESTTAKPLFAIYYTMPNGVYALNRVGSNYYARCDSTYNLDAVYQESRTTAPMSGSERQFLFKFIYRPATNDYVIRSMMNNELILYHDSSNVPRVARLTSGGVPASDSNLSTDYTWKMIPAKEGDNFYEYIYHERNNTVFFLQGTTSTPNYHLSLTTTSSDPGTKWSLNVYSGQSIHGVEWRVTFPKMITNQSFTFKAYIYDDRVGVNGPATYSITDTNGSATNLATIGLSSGTVNTLFTGQVLVHASYQNAPSGVECTFNSTIYQSLEGKCYLQNRGRARFAQLDDGDGPNFNQNGGIMEIFPLNYGDEQLWEITPVGGIYYKITSVMNGYAITVPENNLYSDDVDLIMRPYNGTDNQKWSIWLTANNSYKIKAKSSESYSDKDLVMDLESKEYFWQSSNGLNIRQREYLDNTSYNDEWFIKPLKIRLINHFDSTFSDEEFIDDAIDFVNLVYGDLCHVSFYMDTDPSELPGTVIDDCQTGDNNPCSLSLCGTDCSNHHKNYQKVLSWLKEEYGTSFQYTAKIIWSNRAANTFCGDIGFHNTLVALGVTDNYEILVMRVQGNTDNYKKASMSITLLHELTHVFGMDDVYSLPDHNGDEPNYQYVCAMGSYPNNDDLAYSFYSNIIGINQSPAFCQSCAQTIRHKILSKITTSYD